MAEKKFPIIVVSFFYLLSFVAAIMVKSAWPIAVLSILVFVIWPRWWGMIVAGFAFTVFLRNPWPLIASVFFSFLGKPKRWWPVPAGIAFALVEVLSFYMSERALGITRGYTVMGAIIEYLISPERIEKELEYFTIYEPYIDWTSALILGVITGSFLSSRYSGDFKVRFVPEIWKESKGPSIMKRWMWAFLAGGLMGFAARVGGGCVSGMLISGSIQLAPAGFIFMMSLWIGGVLVTFLFYRSRTIVIKRE
ncbi:MAG: YeeE/YedE family protein [Candidatus Magnetoovum sp. WYHC-5]|nr:YeeE/YedE family protein [Candidatus Magnetoovum sp. WYHC-5]